MEIIKIGEKTWQNAVIHQIHQSFFTANGFYCAVTWQRWMPQSVPICLQIGKITLHFTNKEAILQGSMLLTQPKLY